MFHLLHLEDSHMLKFMEIAIKINGNSYQYVNSAILLSLLLAKTKMQLSGNPWIIVPEKKKKWVTRWYFLK